MSPLSPDRTPHRSTSRIDVTVSDATVSPVMGVYLVRHADAKSRSSWPDADHLRPLTKKGQRQARGLIPLYDSVNIRRVLSSPAVRCVATVAPLASKAGLDVQESKALE